MINPNNKMVAYYSSLGNTLDPLTGIELPDYAVSIIHDATINDLGSLLVDVNNSQVITSAVNIVVDAVTLSAVPRIDDYCIVDGKKYIIRGIVNPSDYYLLTCHMANDSRVYDKTTETFLANWTGSDYTKIVLDELICAIKYNVFAGQVPNNFFLYTPTGDIFNSVLLAIYNNGAIGVTLTNVGLPASSYIEQGMYSGITGDGSNYLDTNWNPRTHTSFSDFHLSVYANDLVLVEDGPLVGVTNLNIGTDGAAIVGESDIITVGFGTSTSGFYYMESNAANSLTTYFNDVLVSTSNTVRSIEHTNSDLMLFTDDTWNFSTASIYAVTGGSALTSNQRTSLYRALTVFNTRLGRL